MWEACWVLPETCPSLPLVMPALPQLPTPCCPAATLLIKHSLLGDPHHSSTSFLGHWHAEPGPVWPTHASCQEFGASQMALVVQNPPAMEETQVPSLGQEDPLEEGTITTPIFLPGEPHGQRSLEGYSPQGLKESDMTETT